MPRLDRSSIPKDVSREKPHKLPDGRTVIGFYAPNQKYPQGRIKFCQKGRIGGRGGGGSYYAVKKGSGSKLCRNQISRRFSAHG